MKNNIQNLRFAYLDENEKPILTEMHTGKKIDDLTKEQLISKIRLVEELLSGISEAASDLHNDSIESDTSIDYIIKELELISDASSFALANLRRTNIEE